MGVYLGSLGYNSNTGSTSYTNTPTVNNSKNSSLSFDVGPDVMWFIQNNLAVGGTFGINFYSSTSKNSNTNSSITSESKYNSPYISIGPKARYYFGGSKTGMPYAEVSLGVSISPSKSKNTNSSGTSYEYTSKGNPNFRAAFNLGYEHFVSKAIGLYGSIGYSYSQNKSTTDYKPSTGTGYSYTTDYKYSSVPVRIGLNIHLTAKAKK